jgi:adenylate kinase
MKELDFGLNLQQSEILFNPENSRLNRVVTITGVTGVGKDFLIGRLTQDGLIPNEISILNMGTLLSSISNKGRDSLRELPIETLSQNLSLTVPKIISAQPAILNTHLIVRQNDYLIFNPNFEQMISPQWYVAVISDPNLIISWRQKRNERGERQSSVENEETITFHQRMIIDTLKNLHSSLGSGVALLINRPDRFDRNISFLEKISSSLIT